MSEPASPTEDSSPRPEILAKLQAVASIIAPLTVATAILGYIGWVRYRAIFDYFGISSALISLTPQDYLLESGVVGFGGLLLAALSVTALIAVDKIATAVLVLSDKKLQKLWPESNEWRLRVFRLVMASYGVILVLTGLGGAVTAVMHASIPTVGGSLFLAVGTLLVLRFGLTWCGQHRLLPPGVPAFCISLLLLAGFWALSAYSENLGDGGARDLENTAEALPLVTVYSRDPLDLAGNNVQASRILDINNSWAYRYTGAHLLAYSNNRWFLVVDPPSKTYRSSITVLPDNDKVRVELSVPK